MILTGTQGWKKHFSEDGRRLSEQTSGTLHSLHLAPALRLLFWLLPWPWLLFLGIRLMNSLFSRFSNFSFSMRPTLITFFNTATCDHPPPQLFQSTSLYFSLFHSICHVLIYCTNYFFIILLVFHPSLCQKGSFIEASIFVHGCITCIQNSAWHTEGKR